MQYLKGHVGRKSTVVLTIRCIHCNHSCVDNGIPEEYSGMKYGGECVWEDKLEESSSTRECLPLLLTNSGNQHLQHLYWRDTHFGHRVVHLREQASSHET